MRDLHVPNQLLLAVKIGACHGQSGHLWKAALLISKLTPAWHGKTLSLKYVRVVVVLMRLTILLLGMTPQWSATWICQGRFGWSFIVIIIIICYCCCCCCCCGRQRRCCRCRRRRRRRRRGHADWDRLFCLFKHIVERLRRASGSCFGIKSFSLCRAAAPNVPWSSKPTCAATLSNLAGL